MKLKKCLRITKSSKYSIFVYLPKELKEIDEDLLKVINIERNEKGELPHTYDDFMKCKVKEIIPHSDGVNIVVEINSPHLVFL